MFWIPRRHSEDVQLFTLSATRAGCVGSTGRELMMGGVTTAAAVEALEQATGRDLLWSTSQFVSAAFAERDFEIEVEELVSGRSVTQARATLRDGERTVLTVMGALGTRPEAVEHCFFEMPDVAAPQACAVKSLGSDDDAAARENLFAQFDRRLALESDETGTEHLWFRPRQITEPSAGLYAVLADFLAGGHTLTRGSTSLDNTLRVLASKPTKWILAVNQFTAIGPRVFCGRMHLFAEDGTLLAEASQTGMLPRRRAPRR